MDISALASGDFISYGVLATGALTVVWFLFKRELSRADEKVRIIENKLEAIEKSISLHAEKISINAERDKNDYKILQSDLNRLESDVTKDLNVLHQVLDSKIDTIQANLERILQEINSYKDYITKNK